MSRRRGNPAVVWLPRSGVTRAAEAVPCNVCDARIGQPCIKGEAPPGCAPRPPVPHRFRCEMAEEFGFRDVGAAGPLFERRAPELHVPCTPENECSDPGSQYCRCHRMSAGAVE